MHELFGIPTTALAGAAALAFVVLLGAVGVLALRNRVLVKLALRGIPRRPGRSALIVVGLMLGTTIVAAALATGDTMSSTIRSSVVRSLGQTDEVVSVIGADARTIEADGASQAVSFDASLVAPIRDAARRMPLVDGVAPAIIRMVAVQDAASRQSEPRVTLFASDPAALAAFGPMRAGDARVSLGDLRPGQVFLNGTAADELDARAGDRVRILAGTRTGAATVRAIVSYDGTGTDAAAVLLPLGAAQRLLGAEGRIDHVLVSNRGGAIGGARHSDRVVAALTPSLRPLGLEASPSKQDGLELADAQGASFLSLFTTFGSFSIAAGILLIFLIFVMLAAERRGELGIARAIGARRGHVVQLFLFEGVAYDLAAAAVGTVLGIAVAYGMVLAMSRAVGTLGLDIGFDVEAQSIVLAYVLGVLLTLVVVTASAWRVSVLDIATAVRDLPDPPRPRRRRRVALPIAGLLLGVGLVALGLVAADALTFGLGVSVVLVAAAPIARALGVRDRVAYTTCGLLIVGYWLLPYWVLDRIADFSQGYGVFLVGGLMLVVGATWVIVYNAPLLLGGVMRVAGRVRALAPVLRLSMAYPLRNRFRTGVTLAMFTLVVFTLVVGTTISGSFVRAWDDVGIFGGGFEVRAVASPSTPIPAPARTIGLAAPAVAATGAQATVPLEARQAGTGRPFVDSAVNGLDGAFLQHTTYRFAALADGYASGADVWRAMAATPGLAVVDPLVAPRRDSYVTGVLPDLRLSGFFVEDGRFAPVPVTLRDPRTGRSVRLTVIGVLADSTPQSLLGVTTSQRTLRGLVGERARPSAYWLDLRPGADARATASRLESALLANGVEAEAVEETLEKAVGGSRTFNDIIEGFMGLGLIVGVAALGVITARSVVERRQQIGVLRSIGFQQRMIQAAFLAESSFLALTAIVVGAALGIVVAANVVADQASQASWQMLTLDVPWLRLGAIFTVVYVVALLTTLVPARRASRVYPAEALRYQ